MRDFIKMFEDQEEEDRREDERSAAVYDRERMVTARILAVCKELDLDLPEHRGVAYDESDRSCMIRVDGSITLEQLMKLQSLGSNFIISGNSSTGYGIFVEFTVNEA
jgi:hypothetical protein